jgi:hypothetical protein
MSVVSIVVGVLCWAQGCIIVNIVVLCLQHHGQPASWDTLLSTTNFVCLAMFGVEVLVRWLNGTLVHVLEDPWNVLDAAVFLGSVASLRWWQHNRVVYLTFTILRLSRMVRRCLATAILTSRA